MSIPNEHDSEISTVTLLGVVDKIMPAMGSSEPEKVQITIEGADNLFREIRIINLLTDRLGKDMKLRSGAKVKVTIEVLGEGERRSA